MLILGGNQLAAGGYNVDNSLRFNDGSSDSLQRTPASASNRKTWTWSSWVKRSKLSADNPSLIGVYSGSTQLFIAFNSSDKLFMQDFTTIFMTTSQVFRDPSAWYHIVISFDTTQATSSDRWNVYVNGEQVTSFDTEVYPSLNYDSALNSTLTHYVGYNNVSSSYYFDGYLAETVFIDGQALDPTSFGEFDEDSGIWKPIDVSGLTFGTNGFYLPYENSAALGQDDSGNGNNFTVNNLTSIDQSTDTCTNNFCTLNGVSKDPGITLAEGNLKYVQNATGTNGCVGTFGLTQGKWYFEVKDELVGTDTQIGVYDGTDGKGYPTAYLGENSSSWGVISINGNRIHNGSQSSYGSGFSSNDIIMVAIDMDNGTWYAGKNGTWFNSGNPATGSNPAHSGINGGTGTIFPAISNNNTGNLSYLHNFGSPPFSISSGNSDANGYGNFEYAPPSGYYALCTKNLAEYG